MSDRGPGAVEVRPLRPEDAAAAHECSYATFAELDRRSGVPVPERTPEAVRRGVLRVAHLQRTDPDGAWVAELDGRVVGVALAARREDLWFLSLLTVEPALQGAGTGRRLLDAALRTAHDARAGLILSSEDPRALRGYARAGFALHPGYSVLGPVDRSLLPAVPGVRPGDYADDRDLVEDVVRSRRGAGLGPDLDAIRDAEVRLLVIDGPQGSGFALAAGSGVRGVAATTPAAAQSLLWAALAEVGEEATVEFLTADQQWAIEVVVAAGLPLRPGSSVCTRGRLGPLAPYLPSGAFG